MSMSYSNQGNNDNHHTQELSILRTQFILEFRREDSLRVSNNKNKRGSFCNTPSKVFLGFNFLFFNENVHRQL